MPPPSSEPSRTVGLSREGGMVCVRIVYTQRGSVGVLQVTGSLLFVIILCCCVVLCCRSPCVFLHVPRLYCISLTQFVCGVTGDGGHQCYSYVWFGCFSHAMVWENQCFD